MFTLQNNIAIALKQPFSSQMVANNHRASCCAVPTIDGDLRSKPFWRVVARHAVWSETPQGSTFWERQRDRMKTLDIASVSHYFDVWET